MKIIGMISGTSVDGIDAAVIDITGRPPELTVKLLAFTCTPFPVDGRQRIFELFDPATGSVDKVCEMNFLIGEWFAQAALQAAQEAGMGIRQVDLIASHGQTIYYMGEPERAVKSTLQIGEAAIIAARTGVTTVADFRVADMAVGGQGAPMVSYVDWLLYRHPQHARALQNIGGIANVTYLPPDANPDQTLSFDTGPGNMMMDYAVQRLTGGAQTFDQDGRLALLGSVHEPLLAELMAHPYLSQPLPKTTGREQFGVFFAEQAWERGAGLGLRDEDILATFTAYTAASIADSYMRFLPAMPKQVIVGGGGANNPTLLNMLRARLPGVDVLCQEDLGYSSDAKEAVAFAVLAYEGIHGRPGNLPSCTFASRRAILGKVVPGENYLSIIRAICAESEQPS
jgi:anhydro-N-acetylmuramic acid kinase